jgi:hypothetical protein
MKNSINPFIVPPFEAKCEKPAKIYHWWSWHPMYPYWSKSCWHFLSFEEAMAAIKGSSLGLDVYHNKLIMEENGIYTEVADVPCRRLDIWHNCLARMNRQQLTLVKISPEYREALGLTIL